MDKKTKSVKEKRDISTFQKNRPKQEKDRNDYFNEEFLNSIASLKEKLPVEIYGTVDSDNAIFLDIDFLEALLKLAKALPNYDHNKRFSSSTKEVDFLIWLEKMFMDFFGNYLSSDSLFYESGEIKFFNLNEKGNLDFYLLENINIQTDNYINPYIHFLPICKRKDKVMYKLCLDLIAIGQMKGALLPDEYLDINSFTVSENLHIDIDKSKKECYKEASREIDIDYETFCNFYNAVKSRNIGKVKKTLIEIYERVRILEKSSASIYENIKKIDKRNDPLTPQILKLIPLIESFYKVDLEQYYDPGLFQEHDKKPIPEILNHIENFQYGESMISKDNFIHFSWDDEIEEFFLDENQSWVNSGGIEEFPWRVKYIKNGKCFPGHPIEPIHNFLVYLSSLRTFFDHLNLRFENNISIKCKKI